MILLIQIPLLILLVALSIQDFRYRAISWVLLVGVFVLLSAKGLILMKPLQLCQIALINMLILAAQFSALLLYFRFKGYTFREFWQKVMGIGDLLFLLCLSIAFEPLNFIAFVLLGLLVSLIVYGGLALLKPDAQRTVPLAGLLAAVMILVTVTSALNSGIDFYDPSLVLKYFRH